MKPSPVTTSPVQEINERHIPRFDKFYRMCAGASSRLLDLGETSFLLEIKIDQRVTVESAPQLVWNIARSWRTLNPELVHCATCVVHLRRSPGPTGFLLPTDGSRADGDGGMDSHEASARIHEIESASRLPAPLMARYLLGFDPVEVLVRAPDLIPGPPEN